MTASAPTDADRRRAELADRRRRGRPIGHVGAGLADACLRDGAAFTDPAATVDGAFEASRNLMRLCETDALSKTPNDESRRVASDNA